MRIISDHHDYYDCVQAQGQDLTCVWVRRLEEDVGKWPFNDLSASYHWGWGTDLEIEIAIIGFCGKIYPVLNVLQVDKHINDSALCYSVEDVEHFVESHYKPDVVEAFRQPRRNWTRRQMRLRSQLDTRDRFVKFFTRCKEKQNAYENIFIDNGLSRDPHVLGRRARFRHSACSCPRQQNNARH
jgi:hypothetical protein